ncbi:hypothetical protein EMIT0111MI5_20428 [Burkholderia sp. IT-111MI5]
MLRPRKGLVSLCPDTILGRPLGQILELRRGIGRAPAL